MTAALLALLLSTQGPPAYTSTGSTPFAGGACDGTRVQIDATTGSQYCCVSSVWARCGPYRDVPFLLPYADDRFPAARVLSSFGSSALAWVYQPDGSVLPYVGTTCAAPTLVQALSGAGAATCYQLKLNDVANPDGNKTFTMANRSLKFTFTAPISGGGVDGALEIEATGAYTGDVLHIHQHTGNPGAGTDLIHAEASDADVTALRLTHSSSANQAAVITGKVDVTGAVSATSFTGPLTGAVTGNASTATALASDPADCAANRYATAIATSGALTCGQVSMAGLNATGTPDATTYLRGDGAWTALAAGGAPTDATYVTMSANGTLTNEVVVPTCSGSDKLTSNGTAISCATDLTGGAGSANAVEVDVDFGSPESNNNASTVVTGQAWVTATSKVACAPTMLATTSREEGAEDAVVEGLTVAIHSRVVATGFTVTAYAPTGTTGVYKFHCTGL